MDPRARAVTFGEIMLRLSTPGALRFVQASSFDATYGGGEANVAASLAGFGVPASFVTRLPANEIGEACLAHLRKFGVEVSHVARGGDRLGIYFLETGAAQRGSQVVYDRSGSAFATLKPGLIPWGEVFRGASWFHWTGISPAVSEGAAETLAEGIAAARAAGVTVSCDLNYRGKLWKWGKSAGQVMAELVAGADIAIGNEEDAEKVFGIRAPRSDVAQGKIDAEGYREVARELARRFAGLRRIGFTLRKSLGASHNLWSGGLYSPREDEFIVAREHSILPVVDRVGGGDAFSAGLIYGLLRHGEEAEGRRRALEFATAASCLKHSIPGDFNLATVAEVEALARGEASGRIAR
ncbi:MAG: PfkB family carbohydrate kinase [Thermoanaerobaculia bacterium]